MYPMSMVPQIGLTDEQRSAAVKTLSALLADEFVLYTKARNFHWNVTGRGFSGLHKFFEGQYEELSEIVDEIAELIRSLGHQSPGSMAEFLALARLKETNSNPLPSGKMLEELLACYETLCRQLRKDADALASLTDVSGFLSGLLEKHTKTAWMLRATIED